MRPVELTRVAGGILWRVTARGPRLAVVHRRRRGDWSIPKGRVEPGERWRSAALREVAEETGCRAAITHLAGAKLLVNRPDPKLVLYWHMRVVEEDAVALDGEVDEVAWLGWREALARLDHASDRALLARVAEPGGPGRRRALTSARLQRLVVVDGDAGGSLSRALGILARAA